MSKLEPADRLARWALKIQDYDVEIGYRAGKNNQNADTLSRVPVQPVAVTILNKKEEDNWKTEQQEDKYCSLIIKNLKDSSRNAAKTHFNITEQRELVYKENLLVVPEKRIKVKNKQRKQRKLFQNQNLRKLFQIIFSYKIFRIKNGTK